MASNVAKFIDIIEKCFLYLHTNGPTRCRDYDMQSQLDVIFPNKLDMISDVQHTTPLVLILGRSDQQMMKFNFNCYTDYTGIQQRFNYNRGEYEDARHDLHEVPITVKDSLQQM